MATLNGHLTPPLPVSDSVITNDNSSANKRKRESTPVVVDISDAGIQKDFLSVLRDADIDHSFIDHSFASVSQSSIEEPSQKKARISDPSVSTTLRKKLAQGKYSSLQQLKDDASQISEELTASIRSKAEQGEGQQGRLSVDELKQVQKIKTFEKIINDMADGELDLLQYRTKVRLEKEGQKKAAQEKATNSKHVYGHTSAPPSRSGTVLTLFGNAPTPKQLFSSLQCAPKTEADRTIKTELPVEEMSLPNGLSATQVVSVSKDENKSKTFASTFAPSYHLAQLNPPKSHKRSSTRDSRIDWEFKEPLNRSSRRSAHTSQVLPSSDWLSYGGADLKDGETSPREKRKQRDRALSGSAGQPSAAKQNMYEAIMREEEMLFKRAYSSFAPSFDNTKAVVTDEDKSMIWWQRTGQKRFNSAFAIDPQLLDNPQPQPEMPMAALTTESPKEDDFHGIVEEIDELADFADSNPLVDKTNVPQVLSHISDLLETLASYQRIRNSSLQSSSAASRTSINPADQILSAIGKPDEPAKDEHEAYDSLKRELAYLVLKLPPYAVAKLDGDQLEDLGVSKLIKLETTDTRGTLEEDQFARQAKYAAMTSAPGVASLHRSSSTSSNPHYSSTNQRTPAIGQAANTRYGSTYNAGKTPAPTYQRSTSNTSAYSTPASRAGYSQPSNFTRQPSYGQSGTAYHQRTQATSSTYGNYSSQTPQARNSFSSSQPLAQFKQRSQQAAASAVAYQTNPAYSQNQYNSNTSPAKPLAYGQNAQSTPSATRPQYTNQKGATGQQYPGQAYAQSQLQTGSGRATPNYPSQPQTPVNGYQSGQPQQRPPPTVVPRAASGTPQPPTISAVPGPQGQQSQGQGQVNGHAST
ncbi:hypothetical protein K431DRAFT_169517 [Polychaeton citri CBS 116435]|uniref:Uncharacterized protein n=1 Tax=Polychaeton citri CBS 116435 TaxID=1314669 RepID=A0A9P4Q2F9_9PEZI|nr:hypothetical protein K431DRAFT_169517 [Polychaeton citri CBS 116435]